MSIAALCRDQTRAGLMSMAALALAGAGFNARAQSSTDDSEMQCSAQLMGSMVQTAGTAYCRGYLGYSCAGEEYANACNEGALARSRRGETDGAQGNQPEIDEMEKNRRLVEQLPRLPPEANPLLGRWRKVPAPPPSNLLEGLMGLGADVACTLIAGDGPSFEFRADALVHGARTMDAMRYFKGNNGVVFALGERYVRLLAFEFDGRDRIRNDTCTFERVGTVAAAAAPSTSPKPAAVPVAAKPDRSAGPRCATPTTRLGVDTVASVQRDVEARGGGSPELQAGGLAKFRLSTLYGDYSDIGPNVGAVNYDFDASGPAGRLVAVTIVRHTSVPEFGRLVAERKASIAEGVGPLQQKSETEFQASGSSCRLKLITNPSSSFLYETYQLPE